MYFSDWDVLHPKAVDKPSSWTSILHAVKALETGFGWKIGNGMTIRFGFDRWGFEDLDGNSLRASFNGIWDSLVSELWRSNLCVGDRDQVEELYGDRLCDHIYALPTIQHGPPDRIVWFHNKSECYSSNFGYSWLILKKMGYGPHRLFWRTIWKLHVLPKIRIFAWRVGHNLLPTNVKMASIFHDFDCTCHRCEIGNVTIIHALRDCPKARAILSFGGLDGRLLDSPFESGIDWLEDATCLLDLKASENLITVLGNIWNGRSNALFRGKEDDA
ncbi:hypothetical protein J1N35_039970 [Gossypium stocksii]|uniref:Reverse transcriptase zinc-binding domain-containing protein n=1 Tax=Gossypium stocksii TaxID=47602 RepID=A0A9D3UD41_9ROSI|nr:hypothetical protein J1N35_039970 [Gossypium stocksii]